MIMKTEAIYRPSWELMDLLFLGYLGIIIVLLSRLEFTLPPHRVVLSQLIVLHLALAASVMGARWLPVFWDHALARFLRWWYPALLFTFCFESVGKIIHLLNPPLLDPHLNNADRLVFGLETVTLLQQYARPWLTELMYFCYTSYYFFIPAVGLGLYLRRWDSSGHRPGPAFREFMLAVSLTFLCCYLHFLVTPAGGPVFWPDYPGGVLKLHGGPITAFEQWLFEHGTIIGGAFPSSHVAVAVVATGYAIRFRVAPFVFVPLCIGLAISTVYNGYHFGIDVLYGVVIALVMIGVAPRLFGWYAERLASPIAVEQSHLEQPLPGEHLSSGR